MTKLSLAAALFSSLIAASARADVEQKFTYRGKDAYAFFLLPLDGCVTTSINVLTHDIEEKLGGDKVSDRFSVISVDAGDIDDQANGCFGNVHFVGFGEFLDYEGQEQNQSFDPNNVRLQARLLTIDHGSFSFYWTTIDMTWTFTGEAVGYDFRDYAPTYTGPNVYSRFKGKGFTRPARAQGTVTIVPYSPDGYSVPYIGAGRSFSLDSAITPPEYDGSTFYNEQKQAERILYRRHPPASVPAP